MKLYQMLDKNGTEGGIRTRVLDCMRVPLEPTQLLPYGRSTGNRTLNFRVRVESYTILLYSRVGDRIRTCDLWLMKPVSYRTALPRVVAVEKESLKAYLRFHHLKEK